MVPGAAAAFSDEYDTRLRPLAAFTENVDNAGAGNLVIEDVPWNPPYSFEPVNHTIRVKISLTASVLPNSNGVWRYSIANEFGPLPDCVFELETANPGGFLSGDLVVYPHFDVDCFFRFSTLTLPHTHTFYLNRSVASGSPTALTHESISAIFLSEDVVIMSQPTPFEEMTGLAAGEFAFIVGASIVLLYMGFRSSLVVPRAASGTLVIVLAVLLMSFQASLLVLLLAVLLGVGGALLFIQIAVDGVANSRVERRFFE